MSLVVVFSTLPTLLMRGHLFALQVKHVARYNLLSRMASSSRQMKGNTLTAMRTIMLSGGGTWVSASLVTKTLMTRNISEIVSTL